VDVPVIVTRVVNEVGRAFNVRIVREGDTYGRNDGFWHQGIVHDSAEPLVEFWDATPDRHAESDSRFISGLGRFAARYGLGMLIGHDGYGHDHRKWSPGLDLCTYDPTVIHRPEWKLTGDNVIDAIAASIAALDQIDVESAQSIRCELCDAGYERVGGEHRYCGCPQFRETFAEADRQPCARVSVVYDEDPQSELSRWMAHVDGNFLRMQSGDIRRYASADLAHKAALDAAPKIWHEHPRASWDRPLRPPPREGTTTALVLEILGMPRHFPWLTTRDIVQSAADRGTAVKATTVTVALANLERDDLVEVNRTRRPFRYRKGRGKVRGEAK
jgi:hypothetical protein